MPYCQVPGMLIESRLYQKAVSTISAGIPAPTVKDQDYSQSNAMKQADSAAKHIRTDLFPDSAYPEAGKPLSCFSTFVLNP